MQETEPITMLRNAGSASWVKRRHMLVLLLVNDGKFHFFDFLFVSFLYFLSISISKELQNLIPTFFFLSSFSDLGKYGSEEGECSPCAAGTFQDTKGESTCQKCPVDTYVSEQGKSSKADCQKCSEEKSTGVNKGATKEASCLCKKIEFFQTNNGTCKACPPGADCSARDGLLLAELVANPGFWRPDPTSMTFSACAVGFTGSGSEKQVLAEARCCSNTQCTNMTFVDPKEQCLEGYKGALCLVCDDGYVPTTAGSMDCTPCPAGSSLGLAFGSMVGMFGVPIFIAVLVLLVTGVSEDKVENGHSVFGQVKVRVFFLY
jgi:hypothetical protein